MNNKSINRRQFIRRAVGTTIGATIGAIGFPYFVPSSALGKDGEIAPSNRLVMGTVGMGGMGHADTSGFLGKKEVQVVAVCDVDADHLKSGKELVDKAYDNHDCATYSDFRDLIGRKDIDAVVVTTPDHWHALVSIAAAKAGKDIYCEKPLTNTIAEGIAVRNTVQRYGRILQTGSHERSNDSTRFAAELVLNGRIGKLHTIRINLPSIEEHHNLIRKTNYPLPVEPVPAGFDYNMWLGHTPWAYYTPKRCHFYWRFILNHGGGELTDRGAHVIDLAQMGNNTDETGPVELSGKGYAPRDGIYDTFLDFDFECTYANGVKMIGKNAGERGLKYEGTDGWIFVHIHGGRLEAEPKSLLTEVIHPNEIHLGRAKDHRQNFLDSVKTRIKPFATVEIGHRTASLCHLINIAMLTERKLKWDPQQEQIIGDSEANSMLYRPMRSPWHI